MNESLDGGYATIEKSSEQLFSKENSNIIYEIRKENGQTVENVVQRMTTITNTCKEKK